MVQLRSPLPPSARRREASSLDARLRLLRERLVGLKLDAYLLTHAPDIAHLTGFAGHDSVALVTARRVAVVTDARYTEELATHAPSAKLVLRKKGMAEAAAKAIAGQAAVRIGFETNFTTFGLIDGLRSTLKKAGSPAKLVPVADLMVKLRAVKEDDEVVATRRAIEVAEESFTRVMGNVRSGRTEGWVAGSLILEMRSRGATDAAFQPIVAAGPHSSLPHYRPDATPITTDAPLLVDWGALVNGYRSDLTRTMFLGKVNGQLETIYKVVLEANEAAIAGLKAGVSGKAADAVARKIITRAGFGEQFGHSLGHGIGRDIHEEPRLHKSRDKDLLQPGQIVTVEPGIYLPGVGGVRIEDDVLIKQAGCEVLTTLDKSLHWARNAIGG